MSKIIAQGAEALLIKKGNLLIKRRIKKGYRHEHLDFMLRTSRTRHEARLLQRASRVVAVPHVKAINGMAKRPLALETEIQMEFIDGKLLSEQLDKLSKARALRICKAIGRQIAALHDADIVHGDLTTSNIILKGQKVYFIDFGLGFHSARAEDKAVDLHLLREALEAKHFKRAGAYLKAVLAGYSDSKKASFVIERLKKVEARGRYKGKGKRQPLIP